MVDKKAKEIRTRLATAKHALSDWLDLMDVIVKPEVRDRILARLAGGDGSDLDERADDVRREVIEIFEETMSTDQARLVAGDIVVAAVRRLRKAGFQLGTA